MRISTTDQRALLTPTSEGELPANFLSVRTLDFDGTWHSLDSLNGSDWLGGATWTATTDNPMTGGTVTLRRENWGESSSPLVVASVLNTRPNGLYAPLFDYNRRVQILTATVARGTTPNTGDWATVFDGYTDDIDLGGSKDAYVTLNLRDLGVRLARTQIEDSRDYGSAAGVPIGTVMQQILTDNGCGDVSVYIPDDPAWALRPFTQDKVTVLAALTALAQQIGYTVRYEFFAGMAASPVLTLYAVDRTKTVPDFAFRTNDLRDISSVVVSGVDVRNVIQVPYFDTDLGEQVTIQASDAQSILLYGRQTMQMPQAKTSNINTAVEAQKLASAALSDLKLPYAAFQVTQPYCWFLQLGDLITYEADGRHTDIAQDVGLTAITHSITPTDKDVTWETKITGRSAITGFYRTWNAFASGTAPVSLTPLTLSLVSSTAETMTVEADTSTDGLVELLALTAGASLLSGPDIGTLQPSGAQWTITRGGIGSGAGGAHFRAVSPSGSANDQLIVVGEQGSGATNLALVTVATTETTITVRADSSSAGATVEIVDLAGPAVMLSGPAIGNIVPAGATWVFERPAFQSGTGVAHFRASSASAVNNDQAFAIPEVGQDTITTDLDLIVTATTTNTVTVMATSATAGATVQLVTLAGAGSILSGPPVATPSPSGTSWQFQRPAFQAGTEVASFRAISAGAAMNNQAFTIPEIGRDTIQPTLDVQQFASSATTVTLRVRVTDLFPLAASSYSVTYNAAGATVVTPTSPQVPTSVTQTLGTTGTMDFTVTRPTSGTPARVAFQVSAPGRASASASVDVAAVGSVSGNTSSNMIINGDGMVGTITTASNPGEATGWTLGANYPLINNAMADARFGDRCLAIFNLTSAWSYSYQRVSLQANVPYRCSAWMRSNAPLLAGPNTAIQISDVTASSLTLIDINPGVQLNAASSTDLNFGYAFTGGDTGWQYVSFVFMASAATTADVYLLHGNASGGTGWSAFDGVTLSAVDTNLTLNNYTTLSGQGSLSGQTTQGDPAGSRPLVRGTQSGTCRNGAVISFSPPFQNVPVVTFGGGALSEPRSKWGAVGDGTESGAPSATPVYEDFGALGLSASGFTARARLRQKAVGSSAVTDTPVAPVTVVNVGDVSGPVTVSNGPGVSNNYSANLQASLSITWDPDLRGTQTCSITVAVDVDVYATNSWVQAGTYTFTQVINSAGTLSSSPSQSITVSNASVATGSRFRIRVTASSLGGEASSAEVSFINLTYTKVTSGADQFASKTPDTDDYVRWSAVEAAVT